MTIGENRYNTQVRKLHIPFSLAKGLGFFVFCIITSYMEPILASFKDWVCLLKEEVGTQII